MRLDRTLVLLVVLVVAGFAGADNPASMTREQAEREGVDLLVAPADGTAGPSPTTPGASARQLDVLLIPDSTGDTIMSFDPATGALLNQTFITNPGGFSTPICAILNHDGTAILVADQIADVVFAFDTTGVYQGIFAPPGGPNTAILDNIRGISLRPNGNLLVTVGGGTNAGAIAEFDTAGNFIGNFIAPGTGGLSSPFDVFVRSDGILVAEITNDQILRFDTAGAFVSVLAPINNFPEQVTQAANGNYLVADFGGTQEGIVDIQPDGTVVAVYAVAATGGGYRGVWELANGNLLVTTGTGVFEITRVSPSTLVDTKISGVSARFASHTEEVVPVELQSFTGD